MEKVARYTVTGAEGMLTLDPAHSYGEDIRHELTVRGKTYKCCFKAGDQFGPQLAYFSDCILGDRQLEPSGYEGWNDVRIICAIHESTSTRQAVRLPVVLLTNLSVSSDTQSAHVRWLRPASRVIVRIVTVSRRYHATQAHCRF